MRNSLFSTSFCRVFASLACAAAPLAGCGDDTSGGTENTTSSAATTEPTSTGGSETSGATDTDDGTTSTGTGTGTGTDSDSDSGTGTETGGAGEVLSCPALPDGCGEVDFMASAQWDGENYGADGICVFERLRDVANEVGEAAPVALRTGVGLLGDSPSYTYMALGADGTVLMQRSGSENGGESYIDPVMSCSLVEGAYFEGCLMTPSLDCLEIESWTTGCVEVASFSCPS